MNLLGTGAAAGNVTRSMCNADAGFRSRMNAPLPLVVEYQLSEDELVSFLAEGLSRSRLYRLIWPHRYFAGGLCFIAAVMVGSLALGTTWWRDVHARFVATVVFGAVMLLLLVFDRFITSWFIRPGIRRGRYASYLRPIRIEIGPTQISAVDRDAGTRFTWAAIQHIRAARAGIVIHLRPSGALLVPRRAFDDQTAFVYFLEAADNLRRAKG